MTTSRSGPSTATRRPGAGARRAGPRGLLPLPDARDDLRGAAQGRPRGGLHHLPRLQPLARRGLDLRLRGPHPHRAVPHARRRAVGGRGAGVGARPGRAPDRDARRRAHHRHRPPQPVRRVVRPVLGAASNEAGIAVVVHAGDSGQSSNGYAVDGFAANFRQGDFRPDDQELQHRGGGARLPPLDDPRRALQAVPEPAGRLGRERGRVPARPVPQAPVAGQEDAGLLRRGPGRAVPPPRLGQPVLGGRPARRWWPSWGPTG